MSTIVESGGNIVERDRSSVREPFGIGQVVAMVVGVFFIVTGAVGLARVGDIFGTADATTVAGMRMTGLLGSIMVAIGLIALIGAASRTGARTTMMLLGPALIAFGVVALVQSVPSLGFTTTNGVVYVIAGVVAIIGAIATPRAVVTERSHGVSETHEHTV